MNEIKSDPNKIVDVDGETVDANKVDAALKSVGITMLDANKQFRDADDILLELSSKWDSLSTMQRRYVATQLAGSRQQSRLIAMLSDYNRLLELQSAAYNSAGAAEKQYNKTLDSMESKLAILKDAWNEFLLDETISNASKDVVDLATSFLNLINKLNDLPGALGTASKALVAFGVFKGGKKIFDGLSAGISKGKEAARMGESFSENFIQGFKSGLKAKKFTTGDFLDSLSIPTDENFQKGFKDTGKVRNLTQKISTIQNSPVLMYNDKAIENLDRYQKELDDLGVSAQQAYAEIIHSQILSNEQWDDAIKLSEQGVSAENAVKIAKLGVTEAEALEALAAEGVTDATKKQIAAKREEILQSKIKTRATLSEVAALKTKAMAEKMNNAASKVSNWSKSVQEKGGLFKGTKAIFSDQSTQVGEVIKNIKSGGKAIGSITSSIATALGTTTAALVGTVAAVGLVTAAVVSGIIVWNKYFSLEARMAKAQKAVEDASAAAEKAKTRYDNLLSAKDNYTGLQDTLENLVKGTEEWNKALIDSNNQILELLDKYPTLAKYLSNDDGVLKISSEGWDEAVKQAQNSVTATTVGQLQTQSVVAKLNNEQTGKNIQLNDFWEKLNYKNFAQQAVVKNNLTKLDPTSEKYQTLYNSLSQLYGQSNIDKAIENVRSLNAEIEKTNQEIQTYKDSIAQTLAEGAKVPKEFADNFAEQMQDEDANKDEAKRLRKGHFSKTGAADELWERFGIQSTGDQEKDLVRLYQELSGESQEDVLAKFAKDGNINKVNDRQISEAIAQLTISDTTVKKVKKGYEELNKVYDKSSDEFKKFTGLMSDNGKELTSKMAEQFQTTFGTETFLEEIARSMKLDKKDFAELYGFDSFNDMVVEFTGRAQNANELLENSAQEINSILTVRGKTDFTNTNNDYKSLTEDMNLGEQTAFNQKLVAIATEMGQTGVGKFLEVFSAVYSDNSLVNSEKKALLNALPTIDLEDIQTYEDFENVLDNLGIDVKNLSEKNLSNLKDSLGALAATSKRTIIDLTQAKNKLESLKSSKSLVESAIDNNTTSFSEEDWNTLKSAGISMDDFFFTGETYNYLGDMSDLLQKIKDDTNSIRQKMLAQTTKDVEEGAKIADWIDSAQYKQSSSGDIISGESALEIVLKGEDIYDNNGDKVNDAAKEILKQIDPSSYKENMTNDLARKILQGIYDTKYGVGGTIYQDNKSQYGSTIQELQNPQDAQKSAAELQNQIVQAQAAQTGTLKQEAETSDEAAVELERWKALEESATKALQNKWTVLKGSTKELDDYIKKQKKVDKVTDDLREQYKAEYLDLKELQGNIKTTREKTEDLFETLEADPGNNNALSQLADAAQRYLGLNLSQEWLEQGDNLKKFKKGISGTEKEFNQFLANFAKDDQKNFQIAIGFDLDSDEVVKKFQDAGLDIIGKKEQIQEALDHSPITVNAETGEIDFTALYNALYAIPQIGNQALSVIKKIAGANVSFDIDWGVLNFGRHSDKAEAVAEKLGGEVGSNSRGNSYFVRYIKSIKGKNNGSSVTDDYPPSAKSPSGGGGGGGDSEKEYESNYDKYYNLLKKIERVQENRNKLQDEYSKMLDEEDESYGAIANKQSSILSNLKNEVDYQKQLAAGRLSQINQLQAENSNLTGYASYDQNLNKVQINYDAIKSVKDSDLGGKIDDYISDLETWADSYTDSQQTILELQQDIDDLIKAGTIDLDKSTNVLEQIEEIQNDITNIEAKREILLGSLNFSQQELSKSYEDQLTLLKQQVSAQAMLLDEREKQYQDYIKKTVGGNWTKFFVEVSKGRFEVNWDILSKENQTVIDEALERLEQVNEAGEAIQEATEQVNDAKKALQEFKKELNDQANDLFNQTKDSLIEKYQQQIDKLTAINDSINKSNTNILSAISESIEKQRQERENEKTEQNLSDMQNQLAFLKMDTSGANQVQILELQKSIDEQTEDYTDTLIDQRISELEDQNSKAFEQRQTQIDLMQQHLEYIQKTGEINQEVSNLLAKGIGKDGIIPGSALQDLFEATGGYKAMNQSEKDEFWSNVKQNATSYIVNIKNTTPEDIGIQPGTDISNKSSITKKINEDLQKNGKNESIGVTYNGGGKGTFSYNKSDGSTEKTSIKGIHANPITGEIDYMNVGDNIYTAKFARTVLRIASNMESISALSETEQKWADVNKDGKISGGDARKILRAAARLDTGYWGPADLLKLYDNLGTKNKEFDFNKDGTVDKQDSDILLNKAWMKAKKRDKEGYPIFKTGGLANFTGPAWLDGTASKPELVLNQRDTENFIQLKDILSSVMRNINGQTATKTGDTYYEIHIEVDKLDSDYSVDDVANRVKQIITTDANYRNVNLINNLR